MQRSAAIDRDRPEVDWPGRAAALCWKIQPFIAGEYRTSDCRESIVKVNPATESPLYRCSLGAPADVDAAVGVARRRFDDGCWSDLPPASRAGVLMRMADLIELHHGELALMDSLEMGKPITAALYDAAVLAPSSFRSAASLAERIFGVSAPFGVGSMSLNTYEARGVIGAITPWNFPSVNAAMKVAPALAVGNTMVLKPSELSAGSALRIAEIALDAGLPEGVLNVVPGTGPSTGAALASHMDVDLVSFTGSTNTGRKIMELAGRSNGKPLLLECGGKSPHVVFEDIVSLDRVADAVAHSVLWNQAQVCSAHTRLVVQVGIKDALVAKIVDRVRPHLPADPLQETTTFGPLASPAQRDRVKHYIAEGLKAGALPLLLGSINEASGCFVAPTIFDAVLPTMSIAREEIFGPVLCVQTFATEREAVELANGTEFGLAATVWTRDLGRGRRLARLLKAGHVSIRTAEAEGAPAGVLSYEPRKASGFGCELGIGGLQAYSTLKAVTFSGA